MQYEAKIIVHTITLEAENIFHAKMSVNAMFSNLIEVLNYTNAVKYIDVQVRRKGEFDE